MDFAAARRSMVENQLRTNRITDPAILEAMGRLPREQFVPDSLTGIAYVDEDLPLGGGRHLMEPLALARVLQAAEIGDDDAALVVGTGAGYDAAVITQIARSVVVVESDSAFADRVATNLAAAGVHGVDIVRGPLAAGCPERAPFDVIVFGGAVAEIPSPISEQLAENGRLVAVVRDPDYRFGKGVVVSRIHGVITRRHVFETAVPWLPGFEPRPKFVF